MTNPDERAEALAQKVEDEAAAVTDRVERRAEALEERRVENRAEERIEQRSDLRQELHGISEAIGILVDHMDQSLPEERVKQLAEAVLAEERVGRRRLTTKITGFLVVIVLLIVSSLVLSAANRRTLEEAQVTSDYVRNCIQHPQDLAPEEKLKACGPPAAATTNFIKYLNCVLLILPEDRTDTKLSACANKAFGG